MATVSLGRVAYVDRGAYSPGTTYVNKDVVQYQNGSYVLLSDSATGILPTDPAYWAPMLNPAPMNEMVEELRIAKESGELDGKTPVKGTDYFTAADQAAMIAALKASLAKETWTFTLADNTTVTKEVFVNG